MVEAYQETGGNMVAAMEVPADKASSYGVLDVREDMGALVSVKGMVEKPKANEAPSNLAVIGRYILSPNVLRNLDRKQTGAGGEIQLTDAIAQEITIRTMSTASGSVVSGLIADQRRASCRRP